MRSRFNPCKLFLKSLASSHLILSTLIPIGSLAWLFFTGTGVQAQSESGCRQWTQPRLNVTFASNPNPLCFRTGHPAYQIRFHSYRLNIGSVPSYRLATRPTDPWLGKDKADHFVASAFLAGSCYYWGRTELGHSHDNAVIFSLCSVGGLGLAKEVYDGLSNRGTASWKDLLADFLGIGIGILILAN